MGYKSHFTTIVENAPTEQHEQWIKIDKSKIQCYPIFTLH